MAAATTSNVAAIHEAASERPDLLQNPLFVDELVTLLERYLRVRRERTLSQARLLGGTHRRLGARSR